MSKITISICHNIGRLLKISAEDNDFKLEVEPQELTGVDYRIKGDKLILKDFEISFSNLIPWYGSKTFTGMDVKYCDLVDLLNYCIKNSWYCDEATEHIFNKFENGNEITLSDLGCDEFEPKKKIIDKRQLSLFSY